MNALATNTIAQHHTAVVVDGVGEVQVTDNVIGDVVNGGTFYAAAGPVFRDNLVRVTGTGQRPVDYAADYTKQLPGARFYKARHYAPLPRRNGSW